MEKARHPDLRKARHNYMNGMWLTIQVRLRLQEESLTTTVMLMV